MSEKIDIKGVHLCVANIKDGKVKSVTSDEGEDAMLGLYTTDGEFVPIILKNDVNGLPYIGAAASRAIKANPPT